MGVMTNSFNENDDKKRKPNFSYIEPRHFEKTLFPVSPKTICWGNQLTRNQFLLVPIIYVIKERDENKIILFLLRSALSGSAFLQW